MIKGYNAVETIYNDVADLQRELLNSKNAHHYRMMAWV